ncbi:PaaX family transcriptional regulator C-terminal domain-containing protein [Paracoccus alkanivorans]|uniref:ArsR family transcriptional regulator n=1 Tax=Paracoccus alkanivorans TaxID=2116655 RepID=A0A3M0MDA7_9RHOB|nr:PaaX family transcriptional regulator C-terminal domain-containing protein [Paracoccus alkanivorans]RMC35611.1 ArsR family transcriptional regulator [Paracoccus alkanivorans]
MKQERGDSTRAVFENDPPRASSFIVTIYGDVVDPRGGVLWMGTLIECCARHGISESLVRTAVWRLVSAGRLEGQRIGRKSYYRLSNAGQTEFRRAARILFDPPAPARGWLLAPCNGSGPIPPGWVQLGDAFIAAPHHDDTTLPNGPVMEAQVVSGSRDMAGFAQRYWPLKEIAGSYRRFLTRFAPIRDEGRTGALTGAEALALRLRLVDEYRHAALTDPRLPAEALPADWPANKARKVFRDIYLALSRAADRHVGESFADSEGNLAASTPETDARLASLRIA